MNKLEVAQQLALITGRPITEFFNGEFKPESIKDQVDDESGDRVEDDECTEQVEVIPTSQHSHETKESWSEEIVEYQKMFEGSTIVKGGIHNGRQMTKKEYNKYIKEINKDNFWRHPLHFKLFRAEGQNEVFYTRWCDRILDEK